MIFAKAYNITVLQPRQKKGKLVYYYDDFHGEFVAEAFEKAKTLKNRDRINIIKSFISSKGWHIQFNIISGKTLKQAQIEPEKHRDIIVRVAGYCAQFVTLDRTTQNDIISRTEQRI